MAYRVGEKITFEGYADDYDKAIRAVQFSLDGGATWSTKETPDATIGRWIWWNFAYTPTRPGRYLLHVRSLNEDGNASPTPATVEFTVE